MAQDSERTVGFTCGTFDLLHAGHILMLDDCRQHCDLLIVGLNAKGKKNTVEGIFERWMKLRSLRYIDEVIIYEEKDLENILKWLNGKYPKFVRFEGEDHRSHKHRWPEIKTIFTKRDHDYSSTDIKQRCRG